MTTRMQEKEKEVLMLINASNPYMENVMGDYLNEIECEVGRDTGQGMFRFSRTDLAAPTRRFYALAALRAAAAPRFAAGLHVEDLGETVYFKGAIVPVHFRGQGLMTALFDVVHRLEAKTHPQKKHKANVRVFPNGSANLASLRALENVGFQVCAVGDYEIQNNDADRHLAPSVEQNGRVRFLVLEAGN